MITLLDDTSGEAATSCNKDVGTYTRLRHWSRGHVFICRPCGHIDYWEPIYRYAVCIDNMIGVFYNCRSESPSQVFLIVIKWLYQTLQSIPSDQWSSLVLAYDAMCKLDGMKVASKPLPLPSPYDEMWLKVTKVR